MQNDEGVLVELYIPRKCSSSSRIIAATDHAAVQIDLVDVDPKTGRMVPGKVIRYELYELGVSVCRMVSRYFRVIQDNFKKELYDFWVRFHLLENYRFLLQKI